MVEYMLEAITEQYEEKLIEYADLEIENMVENMFDEIVEEYKEKTKQLCKAVKFDTSIKAPKEIETL